MTRECTYDELRPKLASLVERHRIAEDPVLFCLEVSAAPKHWWGYLWGDPEPYDYAHVITAHKLISVRRSKVYKSIGSVSSLHLVDVVAVEPSLTEHHGYTVSVEGAGQGVVECPMAMAARAKFISVLQRTVAEAKLRAESPRPPQPPEDLINLRPSPAPRDTATGVAERLQRLGGLLEQGIITAEEYQQRRQAILAEL